MNTIDPIDITVLDNYDLKDIFMMVALSTFGATYFEEEVPKNSVSIGNIYKNTKNYNCQIKFKDNNAICMCSYDINERKFTCRFYRLESEADCIYGVVNNKETGFLNLKPAMTKGEI